MYFAPRYAPGYAPSYVSGYMSGYMSGYVPQYVPSYGFFVGSSMYPHRMMFNYGANTMEYRDSGSSLADHGPNPFVININDAAKRNNTYRTAIWTGPHLQVTLMSIDVGDDIGLEVHPHVDQFLRIEQGEGLVQMGKSKDHLDFQKQVQDDSAIMVPAGTWHNVTNTGQVPIKLYSIYAPPNHPFGTVDATKADEEH